MSKVLKTVGVIVGAVGAIALVISSAGLAAPLVGAAAGSAAAATTTATFATVGTIASGVAAAAQIGSGLLAKPPRAQGTTSGLSIASNQPTPCLLGLTYYDGILTWDTGYGGRVSKVDNPYRFMVVEYSGCGPVDALVQVYANFQPVDFSGNAATGYYSGFLYRDVRLGAVPEASPVLPQWPGAPRWSMQHKASGHAQIGYSLRFDKDGKVWTSGVPRIGALWRGVRRYDPRLDSTYPGGSGPCRIDDASTYIYTANPALHALGYAYGTYHNGKKVFGVDGDYDAIDIDTFVAWANVCDANDWDVGGIIYEPGDKWNNLKLICQAGGAEPVLLGSTLTVRFSAPRISIGRITADDLADGEIVIPGSRDWRDRKNVIIPKFRSPDHQWTYQPAGEVVFSNDLEMDGERKVDSPQLDLVQSADQATQIGSYILADKRELGPITLPLKPRCSSFRPGDCVTVHIPSEGLTEQLCIVSGRSLDPGSGIVQLTFITETEEKHDFALGRTGTPPPLPQLVSAEELDGTRKINLAQAPIEYSDDFTFDLGDVAILPDGSTWLFISTTPQTGSAPAIGNPHWLQLTGQVEPVYADGTPMRDLQPAEPGATEGAIVPVPGSGQPGNIKDGAGNYRNPGELLNSEIEQTASGRLQYRPLPDAEPVVLGQITLPAIGAVSEAAMRRAEDDIDQLGRALATALDEASSTRATFRDAGFYVDAATGQIRIHAIEQTRERVSTAEIRLNAAEANINLRATNSYVNEQIALAVIDPSQIAELTDIFLRLGAAEVDIDGLNATVTTLATVTELSLVQGRVTTAEEAIDALEGTITTKVDTTTFDALATRVTNAETTLTAIGDTASIVNAVSATRLIEKAQDGNAQADLRALLLGDKVNREQVAAVAAARQELTARIIDGDAAEAALRLALQVRVGATEAAVATESIARASADAALATQITSLTASTTTSINSLTASIANETSARTTAINNEADARIAAINAEAAARGTAITAEETARINAINAERTQTLADVAAEAAARDAAVSTLNAAITSEQTARTNADTALATSITNLSTSLTSNVATLQTNINNVDQARIDGDGALAASISSLSAELDTEVSNRASAVESEAQARVAADGLIAAGLAQQVTAGRVVEGQASELADLLLGALLNNDKNRREVNGAVAGARQEITAQIVSEVEALLTRILALVARVAGNEASIVEESIARVTAVESLASTITSLNASFTGALSAEATARTNAIAAEATTRAGQVSTLEGGISNAIGRIDDEEVARIAGDTANADALTGAVTTLTASISNEAIARASADGALAGQISTLETTVGENTATLVTYGESIDGLEARGGIRFDINGRISGVGVTATATTTKMTPVVDAFELVDPDTGFAYLTADADGLRLQNGKVIMNNGTYMKVTGTGFGTANQFIEWFGPSRALNLCDEASAFAYLKTNGDAYFGGTLSAGVLRNAARTTSIQADAEITIGPFGTNGDPIQVITSYLAQSGTTTAFPANSGGLSDWEAAVTAWGATATGTTPFRSVNASKPVTCTVVVQVERAIGSAAPADWATLTISGGTETLVGFAPTPGDTPGELVYTRTISGSITSTDNTGGTANRTFTATLTERTGVILGTIQGQTIALTATEE